MLQMNTIMKPTLLLDESAARFNIRQMACKARSQGVRFRPHFKTHQSALIGEWFRPEGVTSITVSSVEMAMYFAAHGWQDITIAFPLNVREINAINELAGSIHLGLLVESMESVHFLAGHLAHPVDAWIKVDTGAGRTGLDWNDPAVILQLATEVQAVSHLRLRGLLTHAGHTYLARGAAQVCQVYQESVARIISVRQALAGAGIGPLEISVGDTPGCNLCNLGPVDEIRPGNFIFYDSTQQQIGSCSWQQVAIALACPVVALHPARSEAVIYGGAIHLSKDYLMDGDRQVYGRIAMPEGGRWGAPIKGAYVRGLSQEHGIVHLPMDTLGRLHIGDLLFVLPVHSCLTVQVMGRYLTLEGLEIDTLNTWLPSSAAQA